MDDSSHLDIFRQRIAAVAEAMGATLKRAAYSPNIKERLDFSCAVFDGDARLLAQAAHIPVHLGAMPAAVETCRNAVGTLQAGDVIALNDPFRGGSHLPDVTTVSPVFSGPALEPVAFLATRAHHSDVGGVSPGSMPIARDVQAEGLILPPVRIATSDGVDEDIVSIVCANSRTPEERRGDIAAQLAAHSYGEKLVHELVESYAGDFRAKGSRLIEYAERLARARLAAYRDGAYAFEDTVDSDGMGNGPLPLRVVVSLGDGRLRADFSGTSDQVPGGVNAPLAVTTSAVYYVVACLVGDVPLCAGTFATTEVIAPLGSLVNPRPPAAVAAGNVETSQRLVDVLLGALAQAAPDRVPAASQGTMNNLMIGGVDPRTGKSYTYYETIGGGAGGGPIRRGASGVQVHMTNTRNTPVEALETAFPIRVEAYRLRGHSGGAGLNPGGDGIERRLRLLASATAPVGAARRHSRPWGASGGADGLPGEDCLIVSDEVVHLADKGTFATPADSVLVIRTPGGGGWGERPIAASP